MEFLFSCSTRHLTRLLRSHVSYRVEHSKRNCVSTRIYALSSIYLAIFGEVGTNYTPSQSDTYRNFMLVKVITQVTDLLKFPERSAFQRTLFPFICLRQLLSIKVKNILFYAS